MNAEQSVSDFVVNMRMFIGEHISEFTESEIDLLVASLAKETVGIVFSVSSDDKIGKDAVYRLTELMRTSLEEAYQQCPEEFKNAG
jgi:hypothetical protein